MKWVSAATLVLCGCEANLDAQLAVTKRVENMNDQRREVDDLEQRVQAALAVLPPGLDAGQPPPAPVGSPEPARPPEPPMPLESTMERVEAAKARARIELKRVQLRQLDMMVGEVRRIDRRKDELRRQLEHLEKLSR